MVNQRGGILFYILIGVVLFGALMYTYTRSGSSSTGIGKKGVASASSSDLNEYARMISTAVDKLQMRGCSISQISYETPSGQNVNSNAPSDKSCHVYATAGGNVPYRKMPLGFGCDLTSLSIGTPCNGLTYAGTISGYRLYTTTSDTGSYPYNNGSATATITGATSTSDGTSNTNKLIALSDGASPYNAAQACRTLGSEWYLPSLNELNLMCTNKILIGGFNLSGSYGPGTYKTSTATAEGSASKSAAIIAFSACSFGDANSRPTSMPVRCVRK